MVGIGMRFKEISLRSECLCRQCHHRHELTVAAGLASCPTGTLHTVGAVHYHSVGILRHYGQVAEVYHQIIVAEAAAALGQPYLTGSCLTAFLHRIAHIIAGEELRLLYIHRLASSCRFHEQVGLPTQEGWNLQHVDDLACRPCLPAFMYVGKQRQTVFRLHVGKHL